MKLEEVVDFNEISKEKMIDEVKEYFEKMFNKDIYVNLNIIDPRVKHFNCYGDIDDFSQILAIYPNAIVNGVESITVYGSGLLHVGFTFYNVRSDERQSLIDKHQREYQENLEKAKNDGLLF